MSLPDWNDLPAEARKAACDALDYSGVDENWQGQYALDVYNAIRERIPPVVFPLFRQRVDAHETRSVSSNGPCVSSAGIKPRMRVRAGRRAL